MILLCMLYEKWFLYVMILCFETSEFLCDLAQHMSKVWTQLLLDTLVRSWVWYFSQVAWNSVFWERQCVYVCVWFFYFFICSVFGDCEINLL